MPRTFTAVHHAIWQDDDWRDLSPAAQHLYLVLLTAPDLSFCGVGSWRPRRLLPLARGWRMVDFSLAADELSAALLVVVDQETEEYLIRSFLRHDGVMQHNKTCVSAMNAFGEIASNHLRGIVVHELRRLRDEFSDWPCWDREAVRGVLKRRAIAPGLAPSVAPTPAPEVAPQPGLIQPSVSPLRRPPSTPAPAPAPQTPNGVCDQTPPVASIETDDLPLPEDFAPTEDHKKRAIDLGFDIDDVVEDFRLWAAAEGITSRSWNSRFTSFMKRRAKFAANDRANVVTLPSGRKAPDVGNQEWLLR